MHKDSLNYSSAGVVPQPNVDYMVAEIAMAQEKK